MRPGDSFQLLGLHENGRYREAWLTQRGAHGKIKKRHIFFPASEQAVQDDKRMLHALRCGIKPHYASHGAVPGRSVLSCVRKFPDFFEVLEIDIKNFYPSCTKRIVMKAVGESLVDAQTAAWISNNGFVFYDGHYRLPTGARISTALAELVAARMDARIIGAMKRFVRTDVVASWIQNPKFLYRRFVDNILIGFSHPGFVRTIIPTIYNILKALGFEPNRSKTRIARKPGRIHILGTVVNSKPNIRRERVDIIRATGHRLCLEIDRRGSEAAQDADIPRRINRVLGQMAHCTHTNPALEGRFRDLIPRLKKFKAQTEQHGRNH